MMPSPAFVVKVDVDTHVGLRDGAPRLLELFARHGVRASWFVTMGPDRTGRAALRVFTQKGFLKKMLQSRAPSLYPLSTMLRGTLLPAVPVVARHPERLEAIEKCGQELGIHGFDHVYWHDRLFDMTRDEVRAEVERAASLFEEVLGRRPDSFAAPGWQCSEESLRATDALGLLYRSDTRGTHPYLPKAGTYQSSTLEIPTTLPTLDELLGAGASGSALMDGYAERIDTAGLNVHTVHTEVEGGAYLDHLDQLLGRVRNELPVRTLGEVAAELREEEQTPPGGVLSSTLPGRGGRVCCQGEA